MGDQADLFDNTSPKLLLKVYVLAMIVVSTLMMQPISSASSQDPIQESSDGILWLDYDDGLKRMEQDGKPAMIYFHAQWCTWCDKMESDTFSDQRVIDQSRGFVNIEVDGDREGDLLKGYDVDTYPTVVILNKDGREVNRVNGYVSSDRFYNAMNSQVDTSTSLICPLTGSSDVALSLMIVATIGVGAILYHDRWKRSHTSRIYDQQEIERRKNDERKRK